MRKSFALAFLTAALVAPLTSAQERGSGDLERRRQLFAQHLKSEGFVPKVDNDGDVVFKIEGGIYYIAMDKNDPEFFRMVYPRFWEIKSEAQRFEALDAANHSNVRCKVSKVMVSSGSVSAAVEMLLPDPSDFEKVFERSVGLLRNGVQTFLTKMREDEGGRQQIELPVPPAPAPPPPPPAPAP